MPSIFSKIVAGDIPCHKVAEDEHFLAFLDINPLTHGHTLVIPKIEIDYLFDLDDQKLGDMIIFSKKVAGAIKSIIPCNRIGVTVIGLEVPHAHIHLVPINNLADMNFASPKIRVSEESLAAMAEKLRSAFKV